MYWIALPLALLPAALHWWWTRWVFEPSATAVLPERHFAVAQRVSFVSMLCSMVIVLITGWQSAWILPVQFVTLTVTTYRARKGMLGETWTFPAYLSWRLRFHTGMYGLWWLVALAPVLVAQASPLAAWWLAGLSLAIALAWHHWSGGVLLWLIGASRLERPDLDGHFQRVFAAARVPRPALWRTGVEGGTLANAFAMVTLRQRGVLFFDSLLERLTSAEITAILAHEVAHLEQFHRRRVLAMYVTTTVLIVVLMVGTGVASLVVPGFDSWVWVASLLGVFGAMWLRARRMHAHETDADLRAIELCGDADALIRALIRIYAINHIPRRWSALTEERATHPSLARRIRSIRDRSAATHAPPEPIERLVVASSEPGRCAVIDHNRIAFVWINGDAGDARTILDRAHRVEMMTFDQLRELRVSARGTIELLAIDRHARRWAMPLNDFDAARIQTVLDRVDHLFVALPPKRGLGIVRRAAVVLVILLAAPFNAIGAVLIPALLALRRPSRPIMLALAAALAGTAIAAVNELDVGVVRIVLLSLLTLAVLLSVHRQQEQETQPDVQLWTWIERFALLVPVLVGLVFAVANAQDLFGLHTAIRDRGWFTAALAAMAVFYVGQSRQRLARRAGLGVAVLATAALVVGSPWFMLHAVADPLVANMPLLRETVAPVTTLARHAVSGSFSTARLTPDGVHFVLTRDDEESEYDPDLNDAPPPLRFVAGAFDGWQRELRAYDVAVIDNQRLLVLDRERGSSSLRAEDLRTGHVLWTITLPDIQITTVQASPDGRWRAFARRTRQFERIEGRVGESRVASAQWTLDTAKATYLEMPRNDGSTGALAVASMWREPPLSPLLTDWRETTRLLRVDATGTTEIATSHLRVLCPTTPIDVSGSICVSFDGRSSRFWRIDLSSGQLSPIGETGHMLWNVSQESQHRLAAISNGRPLVIDLGSGTATMLRPDEGCWAQDVGVSKDVVIAMCNDGATTVLRRYRLH